MCSHRQGRTICKQPHLGLKKLHISLIKLTRGCRPPYCCILKGLSGSIPNADQFVDQDTDPPAAAACGIPMEHSKAMASSSAHNRDGSFRLFFIWNPPFLFPKQSFGRSNGARPQV